MQPETILPGAAPSLHDEETACSSLPDSSSAAPGTLPAASAQAPELPKLLMPGEAKELEACEQIIERGLDTFIEVGLALATIREKRLYRTAFATWDEYCQVRWEIRASRARQLCAAAETVRNLGLPPGSVTTGNAPFALPASERQARPLMGLPPEEQRAAWAEAVATAPNGKVTGRHVAEVVRRRRLRLGMECLPPGSVTTGNAGPETTAPRTAGQRDQVRRASRLKEAAERAIADVRELLELAGTADSAKAAAVRIALEQLQQYQEHLWAVDQLQESRP